MEGRRLELDFKINKDPVISCSYLTTCGFTSSSDMAAFFGIGASLMPGLGGSIVSIVASPSFPSAGLAASPPAAGSLFFDPAFLAGFFFFFGESPLASSPLFASAVGGAPPSTPATAAAASCGEGFEWPLSISRSSFSSSVMAFFGISTSLIPGLGGSIVSNSFISSFGASPAAGAAGLGLAPIGASSPTLAGGAAVAGGAAAAGAPPPPPPAAAAASSCATLACGHL